MSKASAGQHALRLIRIMQLLHDHPFTAVELAERLEVNKRTIQRDLCALQSEPLYVPIVESDQKGDAWTILRGWRF